MKVYLYNDNFEYIGESEVSSESLPKNSTTVAPLSPSDVIFNGELWVAKVVHTYSASEQAEIDARVITESKQQKLQSLKAWHDSQIEAMKAKYSQAEIDSFLDKRNEAMAWRVDSTAPTPYVNAMANGNAEVRLMLLNSILAKVDATAQLEAFVLLKRDEIEVCTTQAELDAVTW